MNTEMKNNQALIPAILGLSDLIRAAKQSVHAELRQKTSLAWSRAFAEWNCGPLNSPALQYLSASFSTNSRFKAVAPSAFWPAKGEYQAARMPCSFERL